MRARAHVFDDSVPLADIRTAESVGADWCVWESGPRPGLRITVTVELALGICTSMADVTISGLDW